MLAWNYYFERCMKRRRMFISNLPCEQTSGGQLQWHSQTGDLKRESPSEDALVGKMEGNSCFVQGGKIVSTLTLYYNSLSF